MRLEKLPTHSDILPDGFGQTAEFNLKKNTHAMVILNVAGFILFLAAAALVQAYTLQVRPGLTGVTFSFQVDNPAQVGFFILLLLLDSAVLVILHEGIHGLCFWIITGKHPVFSLGPGYAAAAAPGIYIARGPYLVTALSPLVVMTAIGMLLIPAVSSGFLFHVSFITILNIAGAIGDLWVAGGVILKQGPLMVQDFGDRVVLYQPIK
jgi:hypothetical protein